MIEWIRNEMKEIEHQQATKAREGETSDFRWNRKYATSPIPPPTAHQPTSKITHILPPGQTYTLQRFVTSARGTQNAPRPTHQAKKGPTPVEYRPYPTKGLRFSHADHRLQPISSNSSFNDSLRPYPQ